MAITTEDIWQAADELAGRGERATLAAVRKALGGGSYTTISEALKDWRHRKDQEAGTEAVAVPEAVKAAGLDAGKAIWKIADQLVRAEVDGIKTALEEREKEIAQERAEALALADQVSGDLENAQIEIKQLKETLNLAQTNAREAQAVAGERQQRIQALESEVKDAREQASKAEKQAEHFATENETLQSDRDKQKDEYKRQFKKFTEAEQSIQDLRIDNARLEDRHETSERRVQELTGQLNDLQGQLLKLAGEGQKPK